MVYLVLTNPQKPIENKANDQNPEEGLETTSGVLRRCGPTKPFVQTSPGLVSHVFFVLSFLLFSTLKTLSRGNPTIRRGV